MEERLASMDREEGGQTLEWIGVKGPEGVEQERGQSTSCAFLMECTLSQGQTLSTDTVVTMQAGRCLHNTHWGFASCASTWMLWKGWVHMAHKPGTVTLHGFWELLAEQEDMELNGTLVHTAFRCWTSKNWKDKMGALPLGPREGSVVSQLRVCWPKAPHTTCYRSLPHNALYGEKGLGGQSGESACHRKRWQNFNYDSCFAFAVSASALFHRQIHRHKPQTTKVQAFNPYLLRNILRQRQRPQKPVLDTGMCVFKKDKSIPTIQRMN